jgi:predicted dithiol-disulfide oxidoreductase (DUF899 family)
MTGTDISTYTREAPGMSAFTLSDDIVYHTYSTYARGLDVLWGIYQWLDRAPKGRNETEPWFHGTTSTREILNSGHHAKRMIWVMYSDLIVVVVQFL